MDKPSPARPAPLFAEQENVHVTEAEWLKLLGRVPNFHAVAAPANLAARMDSLTKEPLFKKLIKDGNKILLAKLRKKQ